MTGKIAERLLSNAIMARTVATPHAVGTIRRDLPPLRIPQKGLNVWVSLPKSQQKAFWVLGIIYKMVPRNKGPD